jgi:hypothetical protein
MNLESTPKSYVPLWLLLAVSVFWTVDLYLRSIDDFTEVDTGVFVLFTGGALALQSLAYAGARRCWPQGAQARLCASLFMLCNVTSLHLMFRWSVLHARWAVLLPAAMLAFLIADSVNRMVEQLRTVRWFAVALPLAATVILGSVHTWSQHRDAALSAAGGRPLPTGLRAVDFVHTPNVYFVGFESMQPQPVLEKYLGYRSSPLTPLIDAPEFRRFRNVFSEGASTKDSLHAILALDRSYADVLGHSGLSGNAASPLLQIFKHNGYTTHTFYVDSYMGARQGPFVDDYTIGPGYSACLSLSLAQQRWSLFGMCFLGKPLRPFLQMESKPAASGFDLLLSTIDGISQRQQGPQFFFGHAPPLGHTSMDFRQGPGPTTKFARAYATMSQRAADNLQRLVALIRNQDPTALLFVFGDHGIWLSRGQDMASDPTFFVQDRYAVLAGVYPADRCASTFAQVESVGFTTTTEIARLIIRCLADGADPFTKHYDYSRNSDGIEYPRFLYE